MSKPLETCKNCEQEFEEHYKFCPFCGQQARDKLTVGVLFANTIKNYFSFDARFFKSFFPLLFKPGFLANKFVEGKRLLYLHPAQMYLFITIVFFFLFSFIQRKQVETLDKKLAETIKSNSKPTLTYEQLKDSINIKRKIIEDSVAKQELKKALSSTQIITKLSDSEIDSIANRASKNTKDPVDFSFDEVKIDSLIAIDAPDEVIYENMGMDADDGWLKRRLYTQALRFYKSRKGGSILQAFYDTVPIAMFFLLPIFAFILKLFYWKRGAFAHHLVFSFYYFSYLFTVFSIIVGVNFIFKLPGWINFLVALSTFAYLIIALKKFYLQGWFMSLIKAGFSSFIFLSLVAPATVVILGFFAFLFY